jgi:2-haloacid dehalogenase
MPISTVVFDAYGTLFDVAGAARAAAREPGREALARLWPALAENWRRKQLEYTWLRAISSEHADFETVTRDALDWALDAAGLSDPALRDRLIRLYDVLPAYPEVPDVLVRLQAAGFTLAILSNGTPRMLASAVASAGIGSCLAAVLSVEAVRIYKPAHAVYSLVPDRLGCDPADVIFVSSNGWDIAGAAGFGFQTVWVNRAGHPVDRLPHRPARIAQDLSVLLAMPGTR